MTVADETVFCRICHVQLVVSRGTLLGHAQHLDCVDCTVDTLSHSYEVIILHVCNTYSTSDSVYATADFLIQ